MIEINPGSPVSLNDQIKAGLRGLVARDLLKAGDQAPSIRALAARLKVNPNTVARAYRELTLEGFLETRRGDGNYVAAAAARQAQRGLDELRRSLEDAVRRARGGGLSWPNVDDVVRRARREER